VLKKAAAQGVEQLVVFEDDDMEFVQRTNLCGSPGGRPPGDAVLCYLGFTYKDDHTANILEADIEHRSKQEKTWVCG
jgi:hypothetical protein